MKFNENEIYRKCDEKLELKIVVHQRRKSEDLKEKR